MSMLAPDLLFCLCPQVCELQPLLSCTPFCSLSISMDTVKFYFVLFNPHHIILVYPESPAAIKRRKCTQFILCPVVYKQWRLHLCGCPCYAGIRQESTICIFQKQQEAFLLQGAFPAGEVGHCDKCPLLRVLVLF